MPSPGFFIVGAPKAGSTSLYQYLAGHPGICMSSFKEPNYYAQQTAQANQIPIIASRDKYLALFDDAKHGQLCGEASVTYLRAPEAPALIHADIPSAKIIIMLREPGERAFSHYQMRYRSGDIQASFSACFDLTERDGKDYRGFQNLVLEPGFYSQQVPRYLEQFGEDNVLVLIAEEFFKHPEAQTRRALEFLGVDPQVELATTERYNDYREPRSKLGLALVRRKRYLKILKPLVPVQLKWWVLSNVFNRPGKKPGLTPSERGKITDIYRADVKTLREQLNRPDLWQEAYQ